MKKLLIISSLLFGFIIAFITPVWSITYMAYEDWGGKYFDANKSWSNDSNLCWLAAGSNTLAYSGWGFPSSESFVNEMDIYNYAKSYVESNKSGASKNLYEWWFNGYSQNYFNTGGGFYPDLDYKDYFFSTGGLGVMESLDQKLHAGYGVDGIIRTISGSWWIHNVSFWGFDYDEKGNFTGIYFTCSNDTAYDYQYMWHFPIYQDTVWNGSTAWVFNPTGYMDQPLYIEQIRGLAQAPLQNPVPVPNTILLLGSGLIGIAEIRKKFKL